MGKPTYRENIDHLTRRLQLWEEGNYQKLLREGRTIQAQLEANKKELDDSTLAKRFATVVFNNYLKGPMSLLAEKGKGGVLPLNDDTKKQMRRSIPKPSR